MSKVFDVIQMGALCQGAPAQFDTLVSSRSFSGKKVKGIAKLPGSRLEVREV